MSHDHADVVLIGTYETLIERVVIEVRENLGRNQAKESGDNDRN